MKLKLSILLLALITMSAVPLTAQPVSVLHSFTNTPDGLSPWAKLALSGNMLFGTTHQGGTNNGGTIFSLTTDGGNFAVLHSFVFGADGDGAQGGLALSGNTLFGAAAYGGSNLNGGTLFSVNTNGSNFTVLHNFDVPESIIYGGRYITTNAEGWVTTGLLPFGGTLYGATSSGGVNGSGTIFSVATNGSNFTVLHSFSPGIGAGSQGTNAEGVGPSGELVLSGGTLFGVAEYGGTNGFGTIFSLSTGGSNFTVLHSFSGGADGATPVQGLLLHGGALFGATISGGSHGVGTMFSLNLDGSNFQIVNQFPVSTNPYFPRISWVISGNTGYVAVPNGGGNRLGTIVSQVVAPQITGITFDSHVGASLGFSGAPNNLYFVQSAPSISSPGAWQTISTNVSDTNGVWQFTDANTPVSPTQFYRAMSP